MGGSELLSRVAVAAVGIPLVLGLLWLGGWPLGLLVGAAAGLSAWEFYKLAEERGGRPFTVLGSGAACGLVLLATAFPHPRPFALLFMGLVLLLMLLALLASIWMRWPGGDPLESVGTTLMGVLYVGGTLAFVPLLRSASWLTNDAAQVATPGGGESLARWLGVACVLLPLLATWAGDTAAYFGGRAWGRVPMAPAQSPGKTMEGAVAGLLGSALAAVVVSMLMPSSPGLGGLTPLMAAPMGLAIGMAGQLGDLAESVLKRQAGVKNSGTILPGHGGMLDRLDSLFFAVPLTWVLLWATGVIPLAP